MSVVARILALIAVTLLLVAGVEVYNGIALRASREAELRSEATQLARIAALDMDRILEGARQLLATLAKLPTTNGWDDRACAIVAATVNSDFEYDFITAVNSKGQILCNSSSAMRTGATMPYPEILERVLASRDFAIGSYGRGAVSHNEVIRIGYPITDDNGEVVGAVYAGVNATWLNTAINQWQLPPNVLVSIADRNGVIVARNPGETWVGHRMTEGLLPLLRGQSVGTIEERGLDGTLRLFGYVPPDIPPARGLMVVAGIAQSEALAEIDRTIWTNAGGILGVLFCTALAAWLYVRRFIDRPFQRLLSAAASWQSGDWKARVSARTGVSEFDRLGASFDGMAEVVEARDSALRENAERLKRSEEHLARAQRVAGAGSFEHVFESNTLEWSDESYRIFGLDREKGPPSIPALGEMILPEDRERLYRHIAAVREGHTQSKLEFRIRRPDGAVRTIRTEMEMVRDGDGTPEKLIGVCRDVTKIRDLERQRDAFEIQLRQAQKLEALGTLAGGIAHDLNNALVPVVCLSDAMLKRTPEGSRDRETLGLIDAGGKRARDLVRRILTFARKDESKREPLNLETTVANTLKLLRASIPSTIAIEERLSSAGLAYADEGQIVQVLMNLVTNSAQAIGERMGTITVELSEIPHSHLAGHGAAVRLTVEDTGCGMDEATRGRVFDPFFTTKEVGQGTGLGLSVVHGIVTAHAGFITLASEVGRGTRVDIDLPISAVVRTNVEGEAA